MISPTMDPSSPRRARAARLSLIAAVALLALASTAPGQVPPAAYPAMAPLDHYQMAREAELDLARSAAPDAISQHADVLVLGRTGYAQAMKGSNGFVCLVQRAWAAGVDDPEFWNPSVRAPICLNPAAVRSYLPQLLKKTDWALAGRSRAQIAEDLRAALQSRALPAPETGAMCYMMSRQGYLNDRDGHWHPHLMFFLPLTQPATWGAGLPGSPVLAGQDVAGGVTIFLVPVSRWSDGTPAEAHEP